MFNRKTVYKPNQVVIAKREHDMAPPEIIEGYIVSVYVDLDKEEWADIRNNEGNIKMVRTSQIKEVVADVDEVDIENEPIGISSPSTPEESGHADDDGHDEDNLGHKVANEVEAAQVITDDDEDETEEITQEEINELLELMERAKEIIERFK